MWEYLQGFKRVIVGAGRVQERDSWKIEKLMWDKHKHADTAESNEKQWDDATVVVQVTWSVTENVKRAIECDEESSDWLRNQSMMQDAWFSSENKPETE